MANILGLTKARSWKQMNKTDYFLLICILIISIFFIYKLFLNISLDFGKIINYIYRFDDDGNLVFGALTQGLFTTLRLGFWSIILAMLIGIIVGSMAAKKKGFAALPSKLYIQLVRNTPPLILLFIIFFFASYIFTEPLLNFEFYLSKSPDWVQYIFHNFIAPKGKLDIMFAAIITLGIYEGAYLAEIFRGGIESIPKAQWEAGYSMGFSKYKLIKIIIFPQTFRLVLPALVGQSISTFKDSALASIIALPELTFQSTEVMTATNITLELWLVVALFYYIICFSLEKIGQYYEKRVKWYV